MKKSLLIIAVFFSLTIIRSSYAQDVEGEWIQLFNGKDLKGWTPKIKGYPAGENYGNTFRVENGIMKVSFDQYEKFDGRFGHIFYERV